MLSQRAATGADLDALWDLRTRAVRIGCATHYPPAVIAAWSAAGPPPSLAQLTAAGSVLLMRRGDRLAGFGALDLATGEVDALFVDPECQGGGIGRALLGALEAMARAAGVERLFLSAALNAVPFYRRAGFTSVREQWHKHRSGIDIRCVLMEKDLMVTIKPVI